MTNLKKIKNLLFGLFTLGVSPTESDASNRITIFTNFIAVFGAGIGLSVFTQLDKLGVPQKYMYSYYVLIFLVMMVGVLNYFGRLFFARLFLLFVTYIDGYNAIVVFGKTFNGHYVFFIAIIYSVLAFSKQPLWIRLGCLAIAYSGLPILDYYSYHKIYPVTGLNSANFPIAVLLSDTLAVPVVIISLLWIEKALADRHENELKVALDAVRAEKQKIRTIFDNVDLGIMLTDSTLKIDDEYSVWTENILNSNHIAHRELFDLLFAGSDLNPEQIALIKNTLMVSIGEDTLNWDMNKDHLVKEFRLTNNGTLKHISISWTPIVENDIVTKLIVTLRDITTEKEAQVKIEYGRVLEKRGGDILACVMKVGTEQTLEFVNRIKLFSDSLSKVNPDHFKEIRLEFHTFKGEARLIGFSDLSLLIHKTEDAFDTPNFEITYKQVFQDFTTYADELHKVSEKMFKNMNLEKTNWSLFRYVANMREKITEQLQKQPVPLKIKALSVHEDVGVWPEKYVRPLQSILLHSMQNSIDHGYLDMETPRDIELMIDAVKEANQYRLTIEDRGRGIDLKKLAVSWERLDKDVQAKLQIPENMLFMDKFSTAKQVSLTSGRGVGLSAIKSIVDGLHGKVEIKNNDSKAGAHMTVSLPLVNS